MSNDLCYAYRDEKGCAESYRAHIVGIMECLRKCWELTAVVRKLRRLFNVDEKLIRGLIKFSVILHDIGKIDSEIQSECRRNLCRNFPQHYMVSASLAIAVGLKSGLIGSLELQQLPTKIHELLTSNNYDGLNELELYILIVVLPTFLHHYAGVEEDAITKPLERRSIRFDEVCRVEVIDLLNELKDEVPVELLMKLINTLHSILNEGQIPLPPLFIKPDTLFSYTQTFSKALTEAITGLLNLCDGRVAYMNRKCS